MSSLLRKALLVLVAGLFPLGAGGVAFADEGEADLGHHGQVVYQAGRLVMELRTWNHGPVSLDSGAVRVSFSAPVEGKIPRECVRRAPTVLVCETGALRAGAASARRLGFDLRVSGSPVEVVVEVRTVRMGSAQPGLTTRDLNPGNDRRRVLAPDTGDAYYF
ncbi:hypothetical protein [Streptomyces sp. NPDC048442]|uniref:hypothetical protein n=1 Tax=Streptomyces sp. NPDC048442 TaxID=3154823 RepID=UPI0034266D3B